MRGKILKIEEHQSKQGGNFFYVFVKLATGESARTCLYPVYRNFPAWSFILQPSFDLNTELDGFRLKEKGLIDADFSPRPVGLALNRTKTSQDTLSGQGHTPQSDKPKTAVNANLGPLTAPGLFPDRFDEQRTKLAEARAKAPDWRGI